jgi:hypothetical protein
LLADTVVHASQTYLYAPAPPPGSVFVRIINTLREPVTISLNGAAGSILPDAAGRIATAFTVLPGAGPVRVSVDGVVVSSAPQVEPDRFISLVLTRGDKGLSLVKLVDDPGRLNALKVQLRFYNLVEGCAAKLALPDGRAVFEGIATWETGVRAVNPVKATVIGYCRGGSSAPLPLPRLEPGMRLSLFLTGEGAAPRLDAQIDQTEPVE